VARRAREILRPEEATNEGSRLLRVLLKKHTFGALAKRMRCDERSLRFWAREKWKPSLVLRARGEDVLGIRATAWDEAPSSDLYAGTDPSTRRAGDQP